jgi:GDP-L-fucose synthase
MSWSYNRQFGRAFLAALPTNLYRPGDNYHPQNSHVIPAVIRRFHEAKARGDAAVSIWGTASPFSEFN